MQTAITIGPWEVARYDGANPDNTQPVTDNLDWLPASVPGVVQYDLTAAGKLENPYASTKAAFAAAWVAGSDWLYRAEFDLPDACGQAETVLLRLNGVDTHGEVWLGGVFLGATANAYRAYGFTVDKELLAARGNVLLVRVKSHRRMIAGRREDMERLGVGGETEGLFGKAMLRRYQRSFYAGSSLLNLGTGVLGIGINRPVELVLYPGAYLSDLTFRTDSVADDTARGTLTVRVENGTDDAQIRLSIADPHGNIAAEAAIPAKNGETEIPVVIRSPLLWWPAGYGKPELYELRACIEQRGGPVFAESRRIGLRTVELVEREDSGRKTFRLRINGRDILIHGQNHIPWTISGFTAKRRNTTACSGCLKISM